MVTGNEILFQVTYTPGKPQNYLQGAKLKKYHNQRRFYTCNQSDDILYYASHGETKEILSYSEDGKKSYGIFGESGMLTGMQIKTLRQKLQNTGSCIWHGFISFEEEFGNKNCNNIDSAMRFMKRNFRSKFLCNTHLNPDNIIWVAALHENTENLHIHFIFFEKQPMLLSKEPGAYRFTSRGRINEWAIKTAKTSFYNYFLTKSCLVHNIRDSLLANIRERYFTNNAVTNKNNSIFRKLKQLSLKLPGSGSLKYGSQNMTTLRADIDDITDDIISSGGEITRLYKLFMQTVLKKDRKLKEYGKITGAAVSKLMHSEKMKKDIYMRIGNKIIDTALYIKRTRQSPIDKHIPRFKAKSLRRGRRKSILREYQYLLNRINQNALDYFEKYLIKLAKAEREQQQDLREV